jgi:hypothetical protein
MAPPRKRLQLHPHKTSWDFNPANPDMKVLRRPFTEIGIGIKTQEMRIVSAEESTAICRESMTNSPAPDYYQDPSYNWGKQAKLTRKRRRKEHRAALAAAKGGDDRE